MTSETKGIVASLSLPALESICRRCDEFDAAWEQVGAPAHIESYLGELPESERQRLLYELIRIEVQHRRRAGERVDAAEYVARFPSEVETVRLAFSDEAPTEETTVGWRADSTPDPDTGDVARQTPIRQLFGRFDLLELLGAGSFGEVWLARDLQLDRHVALKFPQAGRLGENEILFFLREARAAAKLRHPNIVPVYDAVRFEDSCCIVSGFVRGRTLGDVIRDNAVSPHEAVRCVAQLADALDYAHAQQVVHRDVKPDNIMIDEAGAPQLMDFGLARRTDGDILKSREGMQIGTYAFMSPEQVRGFSHQADGRSDQWSLGVVFYELLTRQRPFQGDVHEIQTAILNRDPDRARFKQSRVHRDLETICLKCLSKQPAKRYQTCAALSEDLKRWLRNEPITARRIYAPERAWRWANRNPWLAAFGALSVGLLIVVAVGSLIARHAQVALNDKLTEANGDLEKTNHDLIQSQRQSRERLARQLFISAREAAQRGDWQNVLVHLDESLNAGYPDPIEIELERIRARNALGDTTFCTAAAHALAARDDLGGHTAEVRMWQGDVLLFIPGERDRSLGFFRAALDKGLDGADADFARAQLAATSTEAVSHLRDAIGQQRWHDRANHHLIWLLIMLGDREEADELAIGMETSFPYDPFFPVMRALIDALEGNDAEMKLHLESTRDQLGDEKVALLRGSFQLVSTFSRRFVEGWDEGMGLQQAMTMLFEAQQISSSLHQVQGDGGTSLHFLSRLPVTAQDAYGRIPALVIGLPFSWSYERQAEELAAIAERHPDGTLHLLRGILYLVKKRHADAERAFAQAAETTGVIPNTEREALFGAAMCAGQVYLDNNKNPGDMERALGYIRRRIARGPIEHEQAWKLAAVARLAGEYELTRQIVEPALHEAPPGSELPQVFSAVSAQIAANYLDLLPLDSREFVALRKALEEKVGNGAAADSVRDD